MNFKYSFSERFKSIKQAKKVPMRIKTMSSTSQDHGFQHAFRHQTFRSPSPIKRQNVSTVSPSKNTAPLLSQVNHNMVPSSYAAFIGDSDKKPGNKINWANQNNNTTQQKNPCRAFETKNVSMIKAVGDLHLSQKSSHFSRADQNIGNCFVNGRQNKSSQQQRLAFHTQADYVNQNQYQHPKHQSYGQICQHYLQKHPQGLAQSHNFSYNHIDSRQNPHSHSQPYPQSHPQANHHYYQSQPHPQNYSIQISNSPYHNPFCYNNQQLSAIYHHQHQQYQSQQHHQHHLMPTSIDRPPNNHLFSQLHNTLAPKPFKLIENAQILLQFFEYLEQHPKQTQQKPKESAQSSNSFQINGIPLFLYRLENKLKVSQRQMENFLSSAYHDSTNSIKTTKNNLKKGTKINFDSDLFQQKSVKQFIQIKACKCEIYLAYTECTAASPFKMLQEVVLPEELWFRCRFDKKLKGKIIGFLEMTIVEKMEECKLIWNGYEKINTDLSLKELKSGQDQQELRAYIFIESRKILLPEKCRLFSQRILQKKGNKVSQVGISWTGGSIYWQSELQLPLCNFSKLKLTQDKIDINCRYLLQKSPFLYLKLQSSPSPTKQQLYQKIDRILGDFTKKATEIKIISIKKLEGAPMNKIGIKFQILFQ